MSVRVFCPKCKGGDNAIWQGSLITWGVELSLSEPPDWYNYAMRHEEAHPGHEIMVEYPSRTVPLRLSIPSSSQNQQSAPKVRNDG